MQATTSFVHTQAWQTLVKLAPNDLGKNHAFYEGREPDLCNELVSGWAGKPEELVHATMTLLGLEASKPPEESWAVVKEAATLLYHIHKHGLCPGYEWADVSSGLWAAVAALAKGKFTDFVEDDDRQKVPPEWRRLKFAIGSIIFAICEISTDYDDRVERFFNCTMSPFWKSFFMFGPAIWGPLADHKARYFGQGFYRNNHKIIAYEHAIYCLEQARIEYYLLPHKPAGAFKFVESRDYEVPTSTKLRRALFEAIAGYHGAADDPDGRRSLATAVALFGAEDVTEFLCERLPEGLTKAPPETHLAETGRLLLEIEGFEEHWNRTKSLRSNTLPFLLAAVRHDTRSAAARARELLSHHHDVLFKYLREVMNSTEGDAALVFKQIAATYADESELVRALYDNIWFSRRDKARLLLSRPKILEQRWDAEDEPNHRQLLPIIRAAVDSDDDDAVREQAQSFLRRKSEHIQKQFDDLLSVAATDEAQAGEMIASAVEFGSESSLLTILEHCVRWVITGRNRALVDGAAQHARFVPAAVPALVQLMHQLPRPDIAELQQALRWAVLEAEQCPVLTRTFETIGAEAELGDRGAEELFKWCYGQREHSKACADAISSREDGLRGTGNSLRPAKVRELAAALLRLHEAEEQREREFVAQRWVSQILAEMSDRSNFDGRTVLYEEIKARLLRLAVEPLSRRLRTEEDIDVRENIVKILGNIGGKIAVDALVRAVTGEEREREARQELLSEYYLKPSKARSEEASILLKDAVDNAKKTMLLLQRLNVATFVLGVVLILGGVGLSVVSEAMANRIAGALAGLGGLTAILTQFLKDPLERIQRAMADLVQIQTAFTSFVWELNLNGTYIQSQYVAQGQLKDYDLRQTSGRIEHAMERTIHLIQVYANGEQHEITPQLSYLLGPQGSQGSVTVFGHALASKSSSKREHRYKVAIDHETVAATVETWTDQHVVVALGEVLRARRVNVPRVWISLIIDGVETNAMPLDLGTWLGEQQRADAASS